jgi:hypothetical protein
MHLYLVFYVSLVQRPVNSSSLINLSHELSPPREYPMRCAFNV